MPDLLSAHQALPRDGPGEDVLPFHPDVLEERILYARIDHPLSIIQSEQVFDL